MPRGFFWWVSLAFLMPVVSDVVNIPQTGSVSAFDKFSYLLMVFVAWEFIASRRMFRLLAVLWVVSLCISFIGAAPLMKTWFKNPVSRVSSFYDTMRYGHMLGPAVVIVYGLLALGVQKLRWKFALGLVFCLGLLVLIGNGTRGVWIAVFPSLICLSFLRPKYLCLLMLLAGALWFSVGDKHKLRVKTRVVSAFDSSQNASHSNRLRLIFWESAWMTFKQYPVFGTGSKGLEKPFVQNIANLSKSDYVNKFYPRNQKNAHNSYLTLLAKYGLVGALPILLLLWIKIPYEVFRFYRTKKTKLPPELIYGFLALYGFLVAAITENSVLSKSGNITVICLVLLLFTIFHRFEDETVKD